MLMREPAGPSFSRIETRYSRFPEFTRIHASSYGTAEKSGNLPDAEFV